MENFGKKQGADITLLIGESSQKDDNGEFTEHEFLIRGCKVRAVFPKSTNEKTMNLVKNMIVDSYIKKACRH